MQSKTGLFNLKRNQVLIYSFILVGLVFSFIWLQASSQGMRRVSLGTNSLEADGSSFHLSFSQDANIATFQSYAHNWANGDPTPNKQDIFIRNELTNQTVQITRGNDDSFDPTVSSDGRYIAFTSYASDLVPNDTNTSSIWIRDGLDVFVYDRESGRLRRASLTYNNKQVDGNSIGIISPDGQHIVFLSNGKSMLEGVSNGAQKPAIYLRHWPSGATERLTYGIESAKAFPNGGVGRISISKDNRYIVYEAVASNLVPGDTNSEKDVFMYDRTLAKTIRVSQTLGGGNANGQSSKPQISENGAYIVFQSAASNLVPGDTNGVMDVFVYTIATQEIEQLSVSALGIGGNLSSREPAICGNGRFVTFSSDATNLVATDTNNKRDVFLRDLWADETILISKNDNGALSNKKAHRSIISDDCQVAGFASDATNLVAGDTNAVRDLFRVDLLWSQLNNPQVAISGIKAAGEQLAFSYQIPNSGSADSSANLEITLPANLTVNPGSLSNGATVNTGVISWSGVISANANQIITFDATIGAGLTSFAILPISATVNGAGQTLITTIHLAVNGLETFLPAVFNE